MAKIDRKELVSALSAVSAGLSKKEVIEQTMSYAFLDGRVYTFNDEITVSCPTDVEFVGAVPAKEFLALLSKLKTAEVDLVITDGTELRVSGSRAKYGIRLSPDVLLPLDDITIPTKWRDVPEDFLDGVKACLSSVSKDAAKPLLMCVNISGDHIESSDNLRLTRYTMTGKAFKKAVLLPSGAAKELLRLNPTGCGSSNGWLHFRNEDDLVFSCRAFDDKFPSIDNFITNKGTTVEFPATILDILSKASAINDSGRVTVTLKKKLITIRSDGLVGWFEESSRTKYAGEPVAFEIEPEYLIHMLKEDADIKLTGKTLEFITDNSIHVVRVKAPAAE